MLFSPLEGGDETGHTRPTGNTTRVAYATLRTQTICVPFVWIFLYSHKIQNKVYNYQIQVRSEMRISVRRLGAK